ncbi:MAG: glycosyltransferase family 4 protein [Anaeromicrobium sp.]|jgi:glycosyltransferase involved in cell wall biosynthesis|uniref:glycosyltransferase family 4 protein n=1 Tax=Anaeromicrobium sp. TaxID=1929132 RepID=UPI0025F0C20B|nr:glycosyltransferase family 4 protein [Anaeromicrobium sp.]MCT4593950.1 glycosyltransferase family 4 protein [Anaeromicrobium sp.]
MTKILQVAAIDKTIYKFILPLMKKLKENNYEVICVCSDTGSSGLIRKEGFKVYNINIDRKISPVSNIKTIRNIFKIIKNEKINIVHTHTPIASVLGRIAAKIAKVDKVIYTAHGLYLNSKIFYYIEKYMIKYFTDYIFTVNNEDYNLAIKEKFCHEDKIKNINGVGINIEKFSPDKIDSNVREEFNIKEKHIVIGFIGRIVKEKGILDLVKAYGKIQNEYGNTKLLIVGPDNLNERDNNTREEIDKLIKHHDIKESVIFIGYRDDIPEILKGMDIFVLPSYREGMPVSLLEAMSMELPVIGTDIRGSREEITKDTGVIYSPGDIDGLANSLEIILKDMKKAKEMGKSARKRVTNHFSEEHVLEKQMEVFKNLKWGNRLCL